MMLCIGAVSFPLCKLAPHAKSILPRAMPRGQRHRHLAQAREEHRAQLRPRVLPHLLAIGGQQRDEHGVERLLRPLDAQLVGAHIVDPANLVLHRRQDGLDALWVFNGTVPERPSPVDLSCQRRQSTLG